MKKNLIAWVCVICLVLTFNINVFAINKKVDIDYVQNEMEEYIKEADLSMEIDDFTVSLRSDIDINQYSEEEIVDLLTEDMEQMKELLSTGYYDLSDNSRARLSNHGSYYTAEVWAGVPSVGWSTVKQDFKATITSGKIKSISFLGDGYMSGVSWGQYNHIRSWYKIYSNNTKVDINIKGNINYLFNLVNTNYTATFLEELQVSGNTLVRQW